jgi:predicted transposase/invertase (TIGR01784 family)
MYDSTCKFIAAQYSEDMARWLLGKAIPLIEIKPSELSLEPIRADSVIFFKSDKVILHIEFQTIPDEDIPFRMLDYAIRLHRKYPGLEIYQVVIYLTKSNSDLVTQSEFKLKNTSHSFNVIRLWEVETETFLENPGLFPFAVLSNSYNREDTLRVVSEKIDNLENRTTQSNISASTAILAGLLLNKTIIQRLLREDIMKQSVIYQEIELQGITKGKREEGLSFVLRLLNRRIGLITPNLEEKIRQLPLNILEDLGEALLDFHTETDLINWLNSH